MFRISIYPSRVSLASSSPDRSTVFRRLVMNSWLTLDGSVHDLSDVVSFDSPLAAWLIFAVQTSPGDMNNWKSKTSSELDAPRKRILTALPLT